MKLCLDDENGRQWYYVCDFCGKSEKEVKTMIVSPNGLAAICVECINISLSTITNRTQANETSIETISGEFCTVIKRPFDAEAVRKSLAIGVPVAAETLEGKKVFLLKETSSDDDDYAAFEAAFDIGGELHLGDVSKNMAAKLTILPALSKHPKPDGNEPPLLLPYRYASEGIFLVGTYGDEDEDYETCGFRQFLEMYHTGKLKAVIGAVDADGNRVEIAIKGE